MSVLGERHGHLSADVGREQPPNRAVLAEGMRDYALATLFKAQLRRLGLVVAFFSVAKFCEEPESRRRRSRVPWGQPFGTRGH